MVWFSVLLFRNDIDWFFLHQISQSGSKNKRFVNPNLVWENFNSTSIYKLILTIGVGLTHTEMIGFFVSFRGSLETVVVVYCSPRIQFVAFKVENYSIH